ncbi:MAG: hypothetical protein V9G08_00970 [Dermatophilaceae bacterium]
MALGTPDDATVVRQRGSVLLGVCAILACATALIASWGSLRLGVASGVVGVATLSFVLLVRPSLVIHAGGVIVNNPARRVSIPWSRVEDCWDRWNLQIYDGRSVVTVWAISSHRDRRTQGTVTGPFGGRGGKGFPELEGPRPERTTASSVARTVEAARDRWAQRVADGQVLAPAEAAVVRRWDYLDLALVLAPIAGMVIAALS